MFEKYKCSIFEVRFKIQKMDGTYYELGFWDDYIWKDVGESYAIARTQENMLRLATPMDLLNEI